MGSIGGNKGRLFAAHHAPLCTRTHQIGSLLLVLTTFILTRLLDRSLSTTFDHVSISSGSSRAISFTGTSGSVVSLSWPERGYGSHLALKIYVYDENEIDGLKPLMYGRDGRITAEGCLKGQWGTQVKIHKLLLKSRYRTTKKEEADLFFVPAYVKCVRMMGGLNDKEINYTYVKVLSQMPYFRRSGGRDHIFVFPSGAGAHLFRSWATYINRSIILTPEGDRTDKKDTSSFNTWKDIIIPGNVDDRMTKTEDTLVRPLPLSKRRYLATYLGRAQGKVGRLQLIELAKQFPNKLESPELKFSGPDKLGRIEYFEHLRNAKFCLAPRGESSWSLRYYESYFVECVPVIISDQVELPFQNVIDYTQISIKWPSTQIGPQMLEYLESIPGMEAVGVVTAVGPGLTGRQVGDLVAYAGGPMGAYAEEQILPANKVVPVPSSIDPIVAASVILKGMTAQFLLRRCFKVEPGHTILVHAAAGGVGSLLSQWANSLGATVIGTVSTKEKAVQAKDDGCHHVIIYKEEDFVARVNEITSGNGVDVVYDAVGKDTFQGSLACLKPRGYMVNFGQSSGTPDPLPLSALAAKSLFLTRPSLMQYTATRDELLATAGEVFANVESGVLRVRVNHTYPLSQAAQAHVDLESRKTTGSVVLIP